MIVLLAVSLCQAKLPGKISKIVAQICLEQLVPAGSRLLAYLVPAACSLSSLPAPAFPPACRPVNFFSYLTTGPLKGSMLQFFADSTNFSRRWV
jgi:hypothetical protein